MNKLMAGIEDLKILLSSMKPELDSREFVFCTFDNPLSMRFDTVYKLISLTVHSSLNAVGLTAAIATKLASKDISANVVAAYITTIYLFRRRKPGWRWRL